MLARGIKPAMARLTLARKIAAVVLVLRKRGESFDPEKLTMPPISLYAPSDNRKKL